jgi:uncharacterized protein
VIREYMAPRFRANDYYGGLHDAVGALTRLVNDEPLPPPLADEQGGEGNDKPLDICRRGGAKTSQRLRA